MTTVVLKLTGNFLYFIGALILVPASLIIITSANTLMLVGPIVLLVPIAGGLFAGVGKWMKRKAQRLEEETKLT